MDKEKLIEVYGETREEREDGVVLYRGMEFNYRGFGENLTSDFKRLDEAFNGYREVYFSESQLCSVELVEGDITVVDYKTKENYDTGYVKAVKFYKEN